MSNIKTTTNWIFPTENNRQPTLKKYRQHIKEAEQSGFMSFKEFEQHHAQWESKNSTKSNKKL